MSHPLAVVLRDAPGASANRRHAQHITPCSSRIMDHVG